MTLFLLATVSLLLTKDSSISANTASTELESARAEYVARAGMQHALWRAQNNACMGDVTIPATALGPDSYDATITGANAGAVYTLSVDQDAWIRNDDETKVNGTNADQHIRFESGDTEHALTRFDLSALPADAEILTANAWFYVSPAGASGGAHPEGELTVHRVTTDWTETDATWETMSGKFEGSILATIPAQAADDVWVSVNLASQVQAWVNGQPNYGILMRSVAEGVHGKYSSREDSGNAPRLEVVVGSGPASPVTVKAKGTLDNGIERTLKDKLAIAYQPPAIHTFRPGPAAGADAEIWDGEDESNYGDAEETWVSSAEDDTTRSLLRFRTSAIPSGAKILAATLVLHRQSGSGGADPVTAHRITNSWSEDSVTWLDRDSVTKWDTAGGDFDNTPVATTPVGPGNSSPAWDITPLVQGWVDGRYPNYGVALVAGIDGMAGERFYTSDHWKPDTRPSLGVRYACECGVGCMAPQGSGNVLMPVSSISNPTPGELYRIAMLESWGYVVDAIKENDSKTNFDDAIAGNGVIYVPATVDPASIGTKLTDAPIGVVTEHVGLINELGIATDSASPVDDEVDIVDTGHYITRVFPAGSLQFKSVDTALAATGGTKSVDAQVLATASGQDALVAIETGGFSTKGGTTTARRVLVPVGDSDVSWNYLTNSGQLVVQRSLAWAMKLDGATEGKKLLLVVGDPASLTEQQQDKKTLIEGWGYGVTLIATSESQAAFETAAALVDVVYVPELGSGPMGELDTKADDLDTAVITEEARRALLMGSWSLYPFVNADAINIIDNTHYITETLPIANVPLSTTTQSLWVLQGTLAPDLQLLGELDGTKPGLAYLESGARRNDDSLAPARRVKLPWGSFGFDPNNLTAQGLTIMQRAIEWGAGAGPLPPPPGYLDQFNKSTCDAATDYAGSDGALDWSPWTWTEVNESDGSCAGQIRVATDPDIDDPDSSRLRVTGEGVRVYRTVDLTGFSQATLRFDYRLVDFPALDFMRIRVFDGVEYTEIDRFTGPLDQVSYQSASYDLSAYAGLEIQIQFEFNGVSSTRTAYIDNVHVEETGGGGGYYLDDFPDFSCDGADEYGGSSGSLDWTGFAWTEFGDDGRACGGSLRVLDDPAIDDPTGNRLRLQNKGRGAERQVDLSSFSAAFLSFDYRRDGMSGAAAFDVAVSGDGGSGWTPLASIGAGTDAGYLSASYDISAYIASNTKIRFTTNSDFSSEAYIDNVRIDSTGGGGGGSGSGGSINFEGFEDASLDTDGKSLTVAKPAGTTAGDLLIATVVTDGENKPPMTAPPGWTLIDHGRTSKQVTMDVLWKIADASEPGNYNFSWAKDQQAYAWIMRFTGHDPTSPINASQSGGGTSSSPNSRAVTATTANTMILRIGGFDDDDIVAGDPGLPGHTAITMGASSTGTGTASGGAGYVIQAGTGDSGTSNFSLTSSEEYRAVTIAIAPAP